MGKEKKGLTATPLWALDDEEKKAAGWTADKQSQESPAPKKEEPVLITRKSTVVKNPWDPMRDSPADTVEEQMVVPAFKQGKSATGGTSSIPPVMLRVWIGFGAGAIMGGVVGGYSLIGAGVGTGIGLLVGLFTAGRKKRPK